MGSDLTPNPQCRASHGKRWQNLTRLAAGPGETTLDDLLAAAHAEPASAKLRFSAPVTTRARCGGCGLEHTHVHWARDLTKPVGACACGGALLAVPFWTSTALPATALRTRRSQPLAAWGVPLRAVVAVEGAQSFVLGA